MPALIRCFPVFAALVALALFALSSALLASRAAGETPASSSEKAGYHLFRPTPSSLMRDMSTDRPDLTESPYSVDAGHFQVEIEAASYSRDKNSTRRVESVGLMDINAKLGLLPKVDLQVVSGTARQTTATAPPATQPDETVWGFTDLAVRLKWNLWGNDAGTTALALMPFVEFPTGASEFTNGQMEGGLIVPLAVSLPGDTGLGLMVEADWLEDADASGFHAEWLTTATLGRSLGGPFGGFVELAAWFRPPEEGAWVGTFNAGVTYAPTVNLQLDTGLRLGVSEEADGAAFFAGISLRR